MQTLVINSLRDLVPAARKFVKITEGNRKFAFYGAMGSGKTTLIKAVCRQLGALDTVTSPTFSLVNEYRTTDGVSLFHIDLYRINSIGELFDIGYEDYFFGDSYVCVEWAEKAEALIPGSFLKVHLEETGPASRLVKISH